MCAHPSQKQAVNSCLRAEPTQPSQQAQTCPPSLQRSTVPYPYVAGAGAGAGVDAGARAVLSFTPSLPIGHYLAGRIRSGSWSQATSEAVGQTAWGAPSVCMVVWCRQNDWLELDDGVACCGTHHTDEQPEVQA